MHDPSNSKAAMKLQEPRKIANSRAQHGVLVVVNTKAVLVVAIAVGSSY